MTGPKMREVLERYEKVLAKIIKDGDWEADHKAKLTHCVEMLRQMPFEQMDKNMRWLGFIQGVFWSVGLYSIEEMKSHNRSDID